MHTKIKNIQNSLIVFVKFSKILALKFLKIKQIQMFPKFFDYIFEILINSFTELSGKRTYSYY